MILRPVKHGGAHRPRVAAGPGLAVIIILACVVGGVTTATEAAAIAVTWSLFLTAVVHRSLTRRALWETPRRLFGFE